MRQVPGAVDVGLSTRGQKPEIEVVARSRPRRQRRRHGRPGGAGAARRRSPASTRATGSIRAGETRDVDVRLSPESRTNVRDLAALPLFVPGPEGPGVAVPLGQVAQHQAGLGPARIDHLNRERVISVQANTEGRSLSQVNAATSRRGSPTKVQLPPGYASQPRRRERGPGRGVRPDLLVARPRGDADVLRAGGAVRLVPRAAARSCCRCRCRSSA